MWKKLPLHWKIIVGLVLGTVWAFLSGFLGWNTFTANWIDPFGTIFIRILKYIAVPLVLFSIVTGVANLPDISRLGKMGAKTLAIYLVTTVFSVSLGLVLVNLFQPGKHADETTRQESRLAYEIWALDNQIEFKDDRREWQQVDEEKLMAVRKKLDAEREDSGYREVEKKQDAISSKKSEGPLQPLIDLVPENIFVSFSDGKLMLQVIFFALFFGIVLALLPADKTKEVIGFMNGMNEVFIKMVDLTMKGAPFFVFCLMAGVMTKVGGTPEEMVGIFLKLGKYALVVLLGLFLMIFVVYPLMLKVFRVKYGYAEFFKGISPAQFLAFSTSSSAATLPVTIECVEENLKVSRKVTSFVLPIGATVNMDGTSLYQAVAVIFLAQLHDIDLTMAQQAGIVVTATLASIGSAAVPSAGLVMLAIVLDSIGLNPMWIAIIFPIDRLLDMCRTAVNVTSDATVASIIERSEGE